MTELLRSERTLSQRKNVPIGLRRQVSAKPCVICGIPFGIKCDHIVPVAIGGDCNEENIQPLCHDCNHIKHCTRDNGEVRQIVARKGVKHFIDAVRRYYTRHTNPYDRDPLDRWLAEHPERVVEANLLYFAFLETLGAEH
jgi:hypothetical protein